MDFGGFYWSLLTIVGPIVLGVIILWAIMRNRGSSQASRDETERATHRLYQEEEAERRGSSEKGP
jgi:hypothetical protein